MEEDAGAQVIEISDDDVEDASGLVAGAGGPDERRI